MAVLFEFDCDADERVDIACGAYGGEEIVWHLLLIIRIVVVIVIIFIFGCEAALDFEIIFGAEILK